MMTFYQFFGFSFSLFLVCSPFVAIPAIINLTQRRSARDKKRVAKIATFSITVILFLSVWIGEPILTACSVRVASFQLAGGFIIFLLALSMMSAQTETLKEEFRDSVAVVPLAIPLIAGPGAISQVIVRTCEFPGIFNHLLISLGTLVVSLALGMCLYFAVFLEKSLGSSGLNVISRIGGLILAAIAVETMSKGLVDLFPNLCR